MRYREAVQKKFDADLKDCIYDTLREYCHGVKVRLQNLKEPTGPDDSGTYKLRDVVSPVLVVDDASGISRRCRIRFIVVPVAYNDCDLGMCNQYRPGESIEDCFDIAPNRLSDIINSIQDTSKEDLFDAGHIGSVCDMRFFKPNLPHGLKPDLHLGVFSPNDILAQFNFDGDGELVDSDRSDIEFHLYVCTNGREFSYHIPSEIPVSEEQLP